MKILAMSKPERWNKYIEDSSFKEKHDVTFIPFNADDDTIIRAGKDAEVLLADAIAGVSGNAIRNMKNLKLIHSEGVGYNAIDIDAASECGIYVCNCKSMNACAVAEQAVLLMLGLLRGVVAGDKAEREGRQMEVKQAYMNTGSLKELSDCRIGFIGFGDIGKATSRICSAMGAKLVYYKNNRLSPEEEAEYHAAYMPLDELLASCDIVSLHVPVTSQTLHMVDRDFLGKMKKGAYLINTARGELVIAEDLLDAIKSGHIAGAGLDCLEGEPVTLDNPMLKTDPETASRILYSPHIAGITGSSFKRGYEMICESIKAVERGEKPKNCVNL